MSWDLFAKDGYCHMSWRTIRPAPQCNDESPCHHSSSCHPQSHVRLRKAWVLQEKNHEILHKADMSWDLFAKDGYCQMSWRILRPALQCNEESPWQQRISCLPVSYHPLESMDFARKSRNLWKRTNIALDPKIFHKTLLP